MRRWLRKSTGNVQPSFALLPIDSLNHPGFCKCYLFLRGCTASVTLPCNRCHRLLCPTCVSCQCHLGREEWYAPDVVLVWAPSTSCWRGRARTSELPREQDGTALKRLVWTLLTWQSLIRQGRFARFVLTHWLKISGTGVSVVSRLWFARPLSCLFDHHR